MYGGAGGKSVRTGFAKGLSPHVRGSPTNALGNRAIAGSIPACTGEPLLRYLGEVGSGVYPRMYGGACVLPIGAPL